MTVVGPARVVAATRLPRPQVDIGLRRRNGYDPYAAGPGLVAPQVTGGAPRTGRLRVLAFVDRYVPFVNAGAEWMLHHLVRDSVRRGHQVDVVTAVPDGPHDVEGVQVWPVAHLADLAEQADVMIGHLLWTRELLEAADRWQVPLLYIVHNDSQVRYWGLAEPNVTMLVHNSRWIADAHQAWPGPASTVRPPVLIEDYDIDRTGAEHITLVNPIPDKGSDTFYALARAHPHRRFLAVAGAYGHQQLAPPTVRNVDWQAQTGNMAGDVYARTRVLLVPSSYESWGRVAVEAMCAGIPVLAHPTPGLREALGDAAQWINRNDHDAWAVALDALDDPDTYRHWSERASDRARLLDRQARTDLDVWDRTLRTAAAAKETRP